MTRSQATPESSQIITLTRMLELAAKAAGYKLKYSYKKNGFFFNYGQKSEKEWNPLTDDGDALRLAVKLGVDIYVDDGKSEVWVTEFNHPIEHFDNDPYAATRRAIVRAAAEIGKEVK